MQKQEVMLTLLEWVHRIADDEHVGDSPDGVGVEPGGRPKTKHSVAASV